MFYIRQTLFSSAFRLLQLDLIVNQFLLHTLKKVQCRPARLQRVLCFIPYHCFRKHLCTNK